MEFWGKRLNKTKIDGTRIAKIVDAPNLLKIGSASPIAPSAQPIATITASPPSRSIGILLVYIPINIIGAKKDKQEVIRPQFF